MADINFDTSELRTLAADLTKAGSGMEPKVRPIVHVGAGNIKRQMRAEMAASRHFGQVAGVIDYSMLGGMSTGVGVVEAEIGPRTGPGGVVGDLAHFAYFGGATRGGTVPDPQGALDAELPGFERALLDVASGIL